MKTKMLSHGISTFILIVLLPGVSLAQQSAKFEKWQFPSFFRGFDIGYYCPESPCVRRLQDLVALKGIGANLAQINVFGESFRHIEYPYTENATGKATLTQMVSYCRSAGLHYTIAVRVGPGRYDIADDDTTHKSTVWYPDSVHQVGLYGTMLKEIAAEFLNDTLFVGLNMSVEPDPFGSQYLSPDDLVQTLLTNSVDMHSIFKAWIDSVRTVDQTLPLIVQSAQLSDPEYWGDTLLIKKQEDPFVVYDFHSYSPFDEYTHYPTIDGANYPGTYWNETLQQNALWDSSHYANVVFASVRAFQQTHNVPIFMGEFGMMLPQNNGEEYLRDLYEIAIGNGWHFALWAWRSDTSEAYVRFDYEKFDAASPGSNYWSTVESFFTGGPTVVEHKHRTQGPATFRLDQNYPNPFNPTTVIRYSLPESADIRISIFDLLGREIAVLERGRKDAGVYTVTWDGRDKSDRIVASGAYFYRLESNSVSITKSLILVR